MRRILRDLKIMLMTNLWIVPVVAALVGALFYFVAPPPPMHARMATGAPSGGYHAFAERLRDELEKQGFTLELVQSRGSQDNLTKLESNEVQLALVQSGQELNVSDEEREKLAGLGVMYREPLWLFTSRKVKFEHLSDLMSLRLGVGTENSGTLAVTSALFEANRIDSTQYPATWQKVGGSRAANALIAGELDAAFFVGPAENALIQRLAASPDVRLVSLRRTSAYLARLPYLSELQVGEGCLVYTSPSPRDS